jgi:hypothetical protein
MNEFILFNKSNRLSFIYFKGVLEGLFLVNILSLLIELIKMDIEWMKIEIKNSCLKEILNKSIKLIIGNIEGLLDY